MSEDIDANFNDSYGSFLPLWHSTPTVKDMRTATTAPAKAVLRPKSRRLATRSVPQQNKKSSVVLLKVASKVKQETRKKRQVADMESEHPVPEQGVPTEPDQFGSGPLMTHAVDTEQLTWELLEPERLVYEEPELIEIEPDLPLPGQLSDDSDRESVGEPDPTGPVPEPLPNRSDVCEVIHAVHHSQFVEPLEHKLSPGIACHNIWHDPNWSTIVYGGIVPPARIPFFGRLFENPKCTACHFSSAIATPIEQSENPDVAVGPCSRADYHDCPLRHWRPRRSARHWWDIYRRRTGLLPPSADTGDSDTGRPMKRRKTD